MATAESSAENISRTGKSAHKFIVTGNSSLAEHYSIRSEIKRSKLRLMDINPQCALNLKAYKMLNKDLFEYREYLKKIKVQILKHSYTAFNRLREKQGLKQLKIIIFTKAFRRTINLDLQQQLKSIDVIENLKESSHINGMKHEI